MRTFTPVVRAVLMAWRHLIRLEPQVDPALERNTITVRVLRVLPEWENNAVPICLTQLVSFPQDGPGAWLRAISEKDLYRMFVPMILGQNFPDAWWLQLLEHPDLASLKEQYQQCLNKPGRIFEDFDMFNYDEVVFAMHAMLKQQGNYDTIALWVREASEWKMAYCLLELELDTPVLEALYHAKAFDR
jgi:hypothetical protein